MENWLILNKLIILIYIASLFSKDNLIGGDAVVKIVAAFLIYIITNVSKALVSNIRYKKYLNVISLFIVLLCIFFDNSYFIMLLPISIFEFLEDKLKTIYIFCILFVIGFLINKNIVNEFILISLFTICFNNVVNAYIHKNYEYKKKLEELQNKNFRLLEDINNQNEYRKQLTYNSQLEERNKIAQEIHDKLGHNIAGSLMQLEAAKLLMGQDTEKSKIILENTIQILREGMESIRATLKNIKPNREQMGYNNLKLMIDDFSIKSKINANIYYYGELQFISTLQWKIIYDNVKEALTNVMKYSSASHVKIVIQILNKLIKIEVKDDGKGCKDIINGIGLSGMEERCFNINGKLILDGSDGFSVIQLLPIEK